jgi:hypothetical protein
MLFIIMQQLQPASIMALMQSQHDWIMVAQCLSPEVQVTVTPSLVMSHLHMPMVRLQQQTIMPFIMQQQLHMPPAIIEHMFWSMLAAILSSQRHQILTPPGQGSNSKVQRGTIIQLAGIPAGMPVAGMPMPGMAVPGMPVAVRSIITVAIFDALLPGAPCRLDPPSPLDGGPPVGNRTGTG